MAILALSLCTARAEELRPAKGRFLVASRKLLDPNFAETVVLLLEYGRRGAFGVVVNRPLEVELERFLPDVEEARGSGVVIFWGGPVRTRDLLLLFRSKKKLRDAEHVFEDVYSGGTPELLRKVLRRKIPLRIYSGHAGWAPRQLDDELGEGYWHVAPADVRSVFEEPPEGLWRKLLPKAEGLEVVERWPAFFRRGARISGVRGEPSGAPYQVFREVRSSTPSTSACDSEAR
ncbi:MAG: hypothetical protein KatS3mg076_0004 [Candidatus Binatia bacterium]|nr:MAG: hypothetical protein KatS3mg076_0004 [Candidatus Binatia bacterium]